MKIRLATKPVLKEDASTFATEEKMSNLVHNEQVKMAANLFNNLAVVSVATGVLAPFFSVVRIPPSATPIITFAQLPINVFGLIIIAFLSFAMFVMFAQFTLMGLKE